MCTYPYSPELCGDLTQLSCICPVSGEGFFIGKVSGQGILFVQSLGAIIKRSLAAEEQLIVDNGYATSLSFIPSIFTRADRNLPPIAILCAGLPPTLWNVSALPGVVSSPECIQGRVLFVASPGRGTYTSRLGTPSHWASGFPLKFLLEASPPSFIMHTFSDG